MLVTWQHAGSVFGDYAALQWQGISPGQVGVGVFCAISGFLAFLSPNADRVQWLCKRLLTLFPAYWIVTCVAFVLAWIGLSNKAPSWGLFVSQMLGMGYFTHGWALVNVVSWFLSLILLCYVIAFVAMHFRPNRLAVVTCLWLVGVVALVLLFGRWEVVLSRHVLAFAGGGLIALGASRWALVGLSLVLMAGGVVFNPSMVYGPLALLLLLFVLRTALPDPHLAKWIGRYSYEYFLIHGIALVGVSRSLSNPWVGVPAALVLSVGAAVALAWLVDKSEPIWRRFFHVY